MVIDPHADSKLDAIVRVSLRAWEPVFESLRAAMGPAVYRAFYGDDWRVAQRAAVEAVCADGDVHVWVASKESRTAGFVAPKLHAADRMGEIYMIAVEPDFQRRGIAASLTSHAVAGFKSARDVHCRHGGGGRRPRARSRPGPAYGSRIEARDYRQS